VTEKCYRIVGGGCPTESVVGWMAERDGPFISYRQGGWKGWCPTEDLQYETGGNTWRASGPLTKETESQLKNFWIGTGSEASLKNSHVIGELGTRPWIETVVDQKFVDTMTAFDESLFSFVVHEKVWDRGRKCPPWEGPFYIATLLPLRPSYDLQLSDLLPKENVAKRYAGNYGSSGARRVLMESAARETPIWRDAYTREVFCTEEGRAALDSIGIKEWDFWPQEVSRGD